MTAGVTPEPDLTASAGYARGLIRLPVAKGADRAALTARSGIALEDLEDQDARIPFHRYKALMAAAKELTGEPALALHFGERVDMAEISILGLVCYASETMMDAFAQINRFGRLVLEVEGAAATGRFEHVRKHGALWLVDTRKPTNDFPELAESDFASMICGTRPFGDTPFVSEVHVTHAEPGHRTEYDRIFQAPTVFDADWNAMKIDEAWLTHRIALQPRYVFGILSQHAEALLKSLASSKSERGKVEGVLMPILHTGDIGMDAVAARMRMSRQTLSRKLKAEGATFEKVLDDLRHRLAVDYLQGRKVSVNETAYLVGFSDPAAFSRAFKRWTGMSPRAMRLLEIRDDAS